MQSVVVGAVIAATLAAAIPVSAKVAVRDHEDVIIRDHEHGSNSPPGLVSRPCRMPHHTCPNAPAEWQDSDQDTA